MSNAAAGYGVDGTCHRRVRARATGLLVYPMDTSPEKLTRTARYDGADPEHMEQAMPLPSPAGPSSRRPPTASARALFSAFAVALLAVSVARADDAQPRAVPGDLVTDYRGVRVADPYRALEDLASPVTQDWAKAESAWTRTQLDRLPGRAALARRIATLDADRSPVITALQITAGGRWFYLKRMPGESVVRLYTRASAGAPERVLLDPERWNKETGVAHAINNYTASPDGAWVAAVVSKADAELGDLRVFDARTGREPRAPVPYVWGELPPAWMPDSRALLYSQSRSAHAAALRMGEPTAIASAPAASAAGGGAAQSTATVEPFGRMQVWCRSLAGGSDRLVAGAGAAVGPPIGERDWVIPDTSDPRHVVLALAQGVSSDLRIYVAASDQVAQDAAHATWKQVATLDAKARDSSIFGHYLFSRTVKDAPRYRIVRFDLDRPGSAPVAVVAQQRGVIEEQQGAADGLYYTVRTGSTAELFHLPQDGRRAPERVALPFTGAVALLQASARVPGAVFTLEGWTHELQILTARGARSASTTIVPPRDSHIGADWVSEEITCTSHDGVEVPVSLVYQRGFEKDGSHPVLLDGYGGYGVPEPAWFAPRMAAFYEHGGIYAEVKPRGGGAFGFEWYQAGVGARKSNTWKDMIACAKTLVARGYTTAGRLAIEGTSMGGVAVGRAVTERPDLFAAGIVRVGITDAIRFIEATSNGPNHEDEMGSLATAQGVKQLLAMSTYHQIRDGEKYPAMLFTAGMNDNRVAPWITFKTFARLQAATASGKPVLLRVEPAGGHGVSETAAQRNAELADRLAFILWQTGDPDFQPVYAK